MKQNARPPGVCLKKQQASFGECGPLLSSTEAILVDNLPFLHSYGEQPMGEGVPSLIIGITRDGKSGMSGAKLARLFRCNPLDLPKLVYGNTGDFIAYKNSTFESKGQSGSGISSHTTTAENLGGKNGPTPVTSQSGRGFTLVATHRIPLSHRAGGKELHLFPSELIATAAVERLVHLSRRGIAPKACAPLKGFVTYFAAKGLDAAIKTALDWKPTYRFLRGEDEVRPYQPLFSALQKASLVKWGCCLPPGAWLIIEEILPGMARAAQTQRDTLGIGYIHMAFNDDGRSQLAFDAEKAMVLLTVSHTLKEYLEHLETWRSDVRKQVFDMRQGELSIKPQS